METRSTLAAACIVIGAVLVAHPAFATSIPIPEPSMLSIYGAAVAGLIIAGRWLRRK